MQPGHGSKWRLCAGLIGLAVLFWCHRARAEVPSELRARLVYSAPSSCPGEPRFIALLAQHSAVVIDRTAPIALRVEVTKDARRHRGRVALLTNEEEGAREVVADRCEDVVRGLALFSAIALDAWLERPPKEEKATVAQPSNGESAPPAPSKPARPSPPPSADLPARRGSSGRQVWFGAGLGQLGATTTRVVRHVGAVGEVALRGALRSTIRLSVNVGAALPESYRDGSLWFIMAWSRLDVCPAWLEVGGDVRASLCPTGELGVQRAALEGALGRADVRPWAGVGGVGRIRASLGRRLGLVASAGAIVPLSPFDFRTRTGVAYATPAVAPVVELGVVVPLF